MWREPEGVDKRRTQDKMTSWKLLTPLWAFGYLQMTVLFNNITSVPDQYLLNSNLGAIQDWCDLHKMVFLCTTSKKKLSRFLTWLMMPSFLNLKTSSTLVLPSTKIKTLNWINHIRNISSATFRKHCLIRYELKNATMNVKLLAYLTSFDLPSIANILENIRRWAVQFIYGRFSCTDPLSLLMHINTIPTIQNDTREHVYILCINVPILRFLLIPLCT